MGIDMELSDYRAQIDRIDAELLRLFAKRMQTAAGWSNFCCFVMERPTRLELATSTLARWRSTR